MNPTPLATSTAVDRLATLVNEKNKILDLLKAEYERKLIEIDRYATRLHLLLDAAERVEVNTAASNSGEEGSSKAASPSPSREALYEYSKGLESQCCLHCHNEIWNLALMDSFPYLLVPKPIITEGEATYAPTGRVPVVAPLMSLPPPVLNPRYLKKQAKKTCSYCGGSGHSRAKCPGRRGQA